MRTAIFGPFDVSRSSNASDNRLINLFPEVVETRQGKEIGALYLTPGLDLLASVGPGPIRGMKAAWINVTTAEKAYMLFVVSGNALYQVTPSFRSTLLGYAANTGRVSIIDNGTQIAVFVGNQGYYYSLAAGFNPIALPFSNVDTPIVAAYQDGFGLITQPGTNVWFQSNSLDFSTWNALNFGSATGDADNVLAMAQIHREIWLFKQFETEIWYNAGTSGFAFARLDGVYPEVGIGAVGSLQRVTESLVWLAQNNAGEGVIVQSAGHSVRRISTHAVEWAIQQATADQIAAATSYVHQQHGHEFYVINVADQTWAYDVIDSARAGLPMWHQRAAFGSVSGIAAGASTAATISPLPSGGFAPLPPGSIIPPSLPSAPAIQPVNTILAPGSQQGGNPVIAFAASSDGSVIVGIVGPPSGGNNAGWWTKAGVPTTLAPNIAAGDYPDALCCSGDGQIIAGTDGQNSPGGFNPIYWQKSNGLSTRIDAVVNIQASACSYDGTRIFYSSNMYTTTTGKIVAMSQLSNNDNVWGCSQDGVFAVGDTDALNPVASWWQGSGVPLTFPTAPTKLAFPSGKDVSYATCCSADATTIYGWAYAAASGVMTSSVACKWARNTGATVATTLSSLSAGKPYWAFGCSADGTIAVGAAQDASGHQHAVWWDSAGAIHQLVATTPSGATSISAIACGISADGSTIVGSDTGTVSTTGTFVNFKGLSLNIGGNALWWPLRLNDPQFHRAYPDNAVFFQGMTVVGDFASANIYHLNPTTLTDNGMQRKWLRSWRALPRPVEDPVSFHKLRIDMETGNAQIDPTINPQIVLRWSDDGGHTWSNEKFEAVGKTGQTAHRVQFKRMGSTRRNSGLDRIFELSSSDAFPVTIVGAELDAS